MPSLSDLPSPPDAAFIGVNRHHTVDIVQALADAGGGGAVCFASGFREAALELADGVALQDALLHAAGDMPILGPNCYGFINAADGAALWPDEHGLKPVTSGVAILAQSSNIALNLTMQARGLPISFLVTVGNQAQTGLSTLGAALLEDPRVTAIGLHIEGIDDLAAFEHFAAKARDRKKPVVVLKVGRSAAARAATISHTAAMVGGAAGASALFDRLGIAEVTDLADMLEALKIAHVAGHLAGKSVASMSCSGGEASLVADIGARHGVSFPALSADQTARLRDLLGPKVALANPLDYHTYIWGDIDAMSGTFTTMLGEAAIGVVVLDLPRSDRCDPSAWHGALEAVKRTKAATQRPLAVLATLPETMPEAVATDLMDAGIIPLCGIDTALAAVSAIGNVSSHARPPVHVQPPVKDPVPLSEQEAKARLARCGLRIPQSADAIGEDAACEAAERIGYPVVLKGSGILHKTEAGAVALNLKSRAEVQRAAAAMPVDTFLVEEMVGDTLAEVLIGIVRDPAHGMVMTVAAGGVLAELFEDRQSLILPVTRDDVDAALARLAYNRVLSGYRGAPAVDRGAILDAAMAVQSFAMSGPVEEVEINPLLCGADFAIAADALVRCGELDDGHPDQNPS